MADIDGGNGFFSMEMPDIQGLIKQLDLMNEYANQELRDGLHEAAEIIYREKKRLVPDKLDFSEHISKSKLYVTKQGVIAITIGYQPNAFEPDEDGINHGIVGMTYEFGRPGKSPQHSSDTMKQVRMRIPNKKEKRKYWKKAVPTEVDWKKGTIQPHPHIRRGFDNKVNEAVQILIKHINNAIDKAGEN